MRFVRLRIKCIFDCFFLFSFFFQSFLFADFRFVGCAVVAPGAGEPDQLTIDVACTRVPVSLAAAARAFDPASELVRAYNTAAFAAIARQAHARVRHAATLPDADALCAHLRRVRVRSRFLRLRASACCSVFALAFPHRHTPPHPSHARNCRQSHALRQIGKGDAGDSQALDAQAVRQALAAGRRDVSTTSNNAAALDDALFEAQANEAGEACSSPGDMRADASSDGDSDDDFDDDDDDDDDDDEHEFATIESELRHLLDKLLPLDDRSTSTEERSTGEERSGAADEHSSSSLEDAVVDSSSSATPTEPLLISDGAGGSRNTESSSSPNEMLLDV